MVAPNPLCDVARGARSDCSSPMAGSVRVRGEDGLKLIGDEKGPSLAVYLNPGWNLEVIISDFTINSCSVSAFSGVPVALLMSRKTEARARVACARKARKVPLPSSM